MPYLPNNPVANQTLKSSQPQIQGNFQIIDSVYGTDHYSFNETATNKIGHHRWVIMTPDTVPTTQTGQIALYAVNNGGTTDLYVSHDGSVTPVQITSGSNPVGTWQFVSTHDFNGSPTSTMNFTGLEGGYDYLASFKNVRSSAVSDMCLRYSTNNGASYDSTAGMYTWQGQRRQNGNIDGSANTSDDKIQLTDSLHSVAMGNSSPSGFNCEILIQDPTNIKGYKSSWIESWLIDATGANSWVLLSAMYKSFSACNAIRFFPSSGTLNHGNVWLFRRRIP